MLSRFKLATKIVICMGLLLLIMIGIGAFSIRNIQELYEADRMLYEKMTVPIGQLNEVTANFFLMRVNALKIILDKNTNVRETHELVKGYQANIEKLKPEIEKTFVTEGGRKSFQDFSKSFATYCQEVDMLIKQIHAGKNAEALAYLPTVNNSALKVNDELNKAIQLKVAFTKTTSDNNATLAKTTSYVTVAVIILAVLLSIGVMVFLRRNIAGIIHSLIDETKRLTQAAIAGQLRSTRGDVEKINFEFQGIVAGINEILEAIVRPLKLNLEYIDRISRGDIPGKITDEFQGDFDVMKQGLNTMVDKLTEFAMGIQGSAEQVASGSQQMSTSAEQMSQAATEQSSSVEEVTSSMEEMNSSVVQNADNARETASISEKAARDAQEGGKAVMETVTAMKSIAEKISVIEAIAGQTNMLALNAAIEAARAGDHGKGFAVVASEVRGLAERSKNAAVEIGMLSQECVSIAERAGQLMGDMVPQIQKTSELIQEINVSSAEQARGIEQVTKAIEQLDKAIQQNAAATEEMASTSVELSSQADGMKRVAGFFKISGGGNGRGVKVASTEQRSHEKHERVAAAHPASVDDHNGKGVANAGIVIDMSTNESDAHFERY